MNNDPTYIKTGNGNLGEITQTVAEYSREQIEQMITALQEQLAIWQGRLDTATRLDVQ